MTPDEVRDEFDAHDMGDELDQVDLGPILDALHDDIAKLALLAKVPARLVVDQHDVHELSAEASDD
jgi:hypothetical protein